MSSHIDQEVLTEILKRLTVKQLVQFRCVCKSWYSLITNPSFITLHTLYTLETNTNNETSLIRHYSWTQRKERYTLFYDGYNGSYELEFGYRSYSQYFEVVGSCHGLLCLSDAYRVNAQSVILWNPVLRKTVILPMPNVSLHYPTYMFVLGFGFDAKRNDYKVVRIVYPIGNYGIQVATTPKVEVYELSVDSWRSVGVDRSPQYVISELSPQVFVNGAVHWTGYNPSEVNGDFSDLSLVLFDLANEVFREMKLPSSVAGLSVLDLSIFLSKKRLCLIQHKRHSRSQWIQYGGCDIWVMKEYGIVESWTKQFCVVLEGGIGKVLGFLDDEEIALVTSNGELVAYDSEEKQVNHLGIKGIVNSFYMDSYVETLVLLK